MILKKPIDKDIKILKIKSNEKNMKFKLNFILLLCSFILTDLVQAQIHQSKDSINNSKWAWNLKVGSSIMATSSSNYLINSYIAPQFSYQQNEKWSFGGGAIISNTTLNSPLFYNNERSEKTATSTNIPQTLLYAFGTYQPTSKITINAMVYKSLDMNNDIVFKNQATAFNNNIKGAMLNMNYQISPHSSLNIGFDYSNGSTNSPFSSRFGSSPMGINHNQMMFGWDY